MGSTGQTSTKTPQMPNATEITSESQFYKLQSDMGQNGNEAGNPNASPNSKIYANTGKAFNINVYLNTDGKSITSPDSNWNGLVSTPFIKDAVKKIDSGMKPLTESVKVTRFVDGDALGYILPHSGITSGNIGKLINKLESGEISSSDFSKSLQGANYTHKAYTSTTYVNQHGSYGNRDIKLNMVLQKGTPAIITNNIKEHEILAGRNLKYNFTGNYSIEKVGNKKQLVIDVYI